MQEMVSDAERVARTKKYLQDWIEVQFPFKRFFPSYGIGGTESKEKAPVKEGAAVTTNEEMATTLKATINEKGSVQIEKTVIEEKAPNRRLNKAIKIKAGKGKISLHRA